MKRRVALLLLLTLLIFQGVSGLDKIIFDRGKIEADQYRYDANLSTDHTYSGTTASFLAGEAITQFRIVSLIRAGTYDGRVELGDNDDGKICVFGIALNSGSLGDSITVLLQGFIRDDSWDWTPGLWLYLDNTEGTITELKPTTFGEESIIVGKSRSADIAYFDNANVINSTADTPNDAYGLAWNEETDTFTRLGTLALYSSTYSNVPYSNIPEFLLTVQHEMKRCLVTDSGVVTYLDEDDSTLLDTGDEANLSGSAGQVMVEIPAHYWTYSYADTVHQWWISPTQKDGWNYFEKSYIGAYEACIWDHSAAAYVGGSSNIVNTSEDILASVAVTDVTAHTKETRAEYRAIAANRGTGWHQLDNRIYAAVIRLAIIEYANFNFQSKISAGLTNASNTDWSNYNAYSPLHASGLTNSLGNASGEVSLSITNFVGGTGTLSTQVMSYRGIENLYGHLWKFIDGANVYNSTADGSQLYICNTPANYADDTSTNYVLAGNLAEVDGYGKTLVSTEYGFYQSTVGASSTTWLCDYYYTYYDNNHSSGWLVVLVGGAAHFGAKAGGFCVSSNSTSSESYAYMGARLCAKF